MFKKMQDRWKQFQLMQQLMKDENFRAFVSHPKVQTLFQDPEFQDIIKAQDISKLTTYPKLTTLMRDPEVAPLLAKIDPKAIFGHAA